MVNEDGHFTGGRYGYSNPSGHRIQVYEAMSEPEAMAKTYLARPDVACNSPDPVAAFSDKTNRQSYEGP